MLIASGFLSFDCPYSEDRVGDRHMTTNRAGEMLPTPHDSAMQAIRNRNVAALIKDAAMRAHPRGGQSYTAIMNMRYGGE